MSKQLTNLCFHRVQTVSYTHLDVYKRQGLKDTLMSHGVSVDNVSVKINDAQESEYNADWTEQEGSRGGNKEQGSQKEQRGKEQFEQMMSFIENENGKV